MMNIDTRKKKWRKMLKMCQDFGVQLYRKAKDVAKYMNEYFITKVSNLRNTFNRRNPNYEHCRKFMGKKNAPWILDL